MTTMDCLVPYGNRIQSACSGNVHMLVEWSAPSSFPDTKALASAPSFSSFDSENSRDSSDSSPWCQCGIPEDVRHSVAVFLSSGDPAALQMTGENVSHYRNIADKLHHVQLINICQNFCRGVDNNGNVQENKSQYTDCLKNNNVPCCLKTPAFQIMFLRPADTSQTNQVLVMDIRKNEIQKIDVKKITRFGDGFASCAVYKKGCPYVLVSGGSGKTSTAIQKYDVVENKWMVCDSMRNPRCKHCMAFLDGYVFLIGGKGCASIEKYSIDNNICNEVARLNVCVHSFAVAVFRDKIYIFGGKTLKGNVRCVQCLDTKTNKVFRLQDLPTECSGGQAIVVNDAIYFATNNGHMIKFTPENGQSELCSRQPFRRKHFSMFLKNSQLILFGGIITEGPVKTDNGETSGKENSAYIYYPEGDRWAVDHSYSAAVDLPVNTSCTVRYPKECPVKPFVKLFGYC